MHTFSINHIALSVKDVNESIEFYKKVLLLTEIKNTEPLTKIVSFAYTLQEDYIVEKQIPLTMFVNC